MGASEYSLEQQVRVLDRIQSETQKAVAADEGMTTRTIMNWKKQEDEIRKSFREVEARRSGALDVDTSMGAIAEYEKKYLQRLSDLGDLEERKKVFVAGIEKVMWDHLDMLDKQKFDEIKPDVRVRMLKDMNEMREKLSGEPSVVMEYRYKFQMVVMEVVKDMIPDRAEEFLDKVKRLEDVEL